ncbi:hypothetical protein AC578_9851 [Pseudocercospora eumusae]|uniref:Uncharacterized protein n=1 Tax=Pseudocercospora eumusae TaxID=321146 RepID=A0A139HB13_9PEZI|nr:hypothetical protein AC578_9851 [Pseudocercospora eumusae]
MNKTLLDWLRTIVRRGWPSFFGATIILHAAVLSTSATWSFWLLLCWLTIYMSAILLGIGRLIARYMGLLVFLHKPWPIVTAVILSLVLVLFGIPVLLVSLPAPHSGTSTLETTIPNHMYNLTTSLSQLREFKSDTLVAHARTTEFLWCQSLGATCLLRPSLTLNPKFSRQSILGSVRMNTVYGTTFEELKWLEEEEEDSKEAQRSGKHLHCTPHEFCKDWTDSNPEWESTVRDLGALPFITTTTRDEDEKAKAEVLFTTLAHHLAEYHHIILQLATKLNDTLMQATDAQDRFFNSTRQLSSSPTSSYWHSCLETLYLPQQQLPSQPRSTSLRLILIKQWSFITQAWYQRLGLYRPSKNQQTLPNPQKILQTLRQDLLQIPNNNTITHLLSALRSQIQTGKTQRFWSRNFQLRHPSCFRDHHHSDDLRPLTKSYLCKILTDIQTHYEAAETEFLNVVELGVLARSAAVREFGEAQREDEMLFLERRGGLGMGMGRMLGTGRMEGGGWIERVLEIGNLTIGEGGGID